LDVPCPKELNSIQPEQFDFLILENNIDFPNIKTGRLNLFGQKDEFGGIIFYTWQPVVFMVK